MVAIIVVVRVGCGGGCGGKVVKDSCSVGDSFPVVALRCVVLESGVEGLDIRMDEEKHECV